MVFCKIICFEVFFLPHHATNCLTDLKRGIKHSFWLWAVIPTKCLRLGSGSKRWLCCLLRLEMRMRPPREGLARWPLSGPVWLLPLPVKSSPQHGLLPFLCALKVFITFGSRPSEVLSCLVMSCQSFPSLLLSYSLNSAPGLCLWFNGEFPHRGCPYSDISLLSVQGIFSNC